MALVSEDGTGLPDADTYGSVAGADAYHAARGNAAWAALDTAGKEAALLKATAKADGYRYKGTRLSTAQALAWPRAGCNDWDGVAAEGTPRRFVQAVYVFAGRIAEGKELDADQERGGQVTSETVGPISVSYADGAPPGTTFAEAENLLKPWLYGCSRPLPFVGGGTAGRNWFGQMDNPPEDAP